MSLTNTNLIKSKDLSYLLCINGIKHVQTWIVMIKILQGSAVAQTTLGGLTTYLPVQVSYTV